MSKNGVTLVLKDLETADLRVNIAIGTQIRGHFTAHSVVRSKEEMKELADKIANDEYENDSALLRDLYTGFDGLGTESGPLEGEDAWQYVLEGKLSGYLVHALTHAYFTQYGEALQKNLPRLRGR